MAFLQEIQLIEPRKEYRIEIDREQILVVFAILTGKGIGGPIAAGHGIHKGVERTAGHHEKRVAHRVLLRATERGVFQYMRHAGGILGHGAQ